MKNGILQEYLTFCDLYNKDVKRKKTATEKLSGLRKVIHECIKNGILREFLKKHQKEVETMLMTVLPPEQAIEFMKLEEYNKGVEEGIEQGIEKGIEQGIEQGIEKGKHDTCLNLAGNMLKSNYSIDSIMEITGLSREEIESL